LGGRRRDVELQRPQSLVLIRDNFSSRHTKFGNYKFTGPFSVSVGYYNVNNEANSHNDQYTIQLFAIMPDYKLNERFDIYAGLMIAHYTGSYLNQFEPIELASGNVLYGIGLRAKISKGIPF
jgi:predicted porin